jgi:hypothetical protein
MFPERRSGMLNFFLLAADVGLDPDFLNIPGSLLSDSTAT